MLDENSEEVGDDLRRQGEETEKVNFPYERSQGRTG